MLHNESVQQVGTKALKHLPYPIVQKTPPESTKFSQDYFFFFFFLMPSDQAPLYHRLQFINISIVFYIVTANWVYNQISASDNPYALHF